MFHDFDEIIENDVNELDIKDDKENYIEFYKSYLISKLPVYLETVSDEYTEEIILSTENKILFFSNDDVFRDTNIISIIVYKKYICSEKDIHYNILLLGTNNKIRKCGYGSYIIKCFFDKIKKENPPNTRISVVLESVESSYNFYKSLGFNPIKKLSKYSHFLTDEYVNSQKKYKKKMLMEYLL